MKPPSRKSIIANRQFFVLEQLAEKAGLDGCVCTIEEYNEYLLNESLRSQRDHMALSWLFRERSTGAVAAYMSLIADADIEHNESVIEFYRKNGFIPNSEMNNKRSKTISMRKDI
jgi:hypothetical protein